MQTIARFIVTLAVLRMAAVPFSVEEIALAQIMQGEANHQFMRSYVPAYCVGWVARNRLETGEYGTSYQELQVGFNGTINRAPQWKYMAMSRMVINARPWNDPTHGALYVWSQQDMEKLGFDVERASLILRTSDHRALYFFVEWPGT